MQVKGTPKVANPEGWLEVTALTEIPQFCSLKFPTPGRFRTSGRAFLDADGLQPHISSRKALLLCFQRRTTWTSTRSNVKG